MYFAFKINQAWESMKNLFLLFTMLVSMTGMCACGGDSANSTPSSPAVAALPTVTTATGTITTIGTTIIEKSIVGTTETVTIKCDSTPAISIDSNNITTITRTETVTAPVNGTVKVGEMTISATTIGTVMTISISTPKPLTGTAEIFKDISGYTTIVLIRQVTRYPGDVGIV